MSKHQQILSTDEKRNKTYISFLELCQKDNATLRDIGNMGHQLMKKNKIHPHFYADHSLFKTAHYLSFFALQLPLEYDNSKHLERKLNKQQATNIIHLFERRISERLPVEYITNEAYYLDQNFYVNENVLVPRSLMNTRFKDFLNAVSWENYRVLDLCTGSGCIGISLALLNPKITVDLVDVCPKALSVAAINTHNRALNDRVQCIQSDLFENIQGKYDLIITNPPYVPDAEYDKQPIEVKNEPEIALKGGKDGLKLIDVIIKQSKHYLNENGLLIAEVGYSPAKQLKRKYPYIPFKWLKYRHPSGKESLLDKFIEVIGYLDSIFVVPASKL